MREPLFHPEQVPEEILAAIVGAGPLCWDDLHDSDRGSVGNARLRLVGVYDDRFEGTFMLRTRIPGGRLSAAQVDALAGVVRDFSVHAEGFDGEPDQFCEVTTRQDVQIHWIRFEHLPEIWRRYAEVGLGSLQACGNSMRNVTACPVDGADPEAAFEVGPIVDAIGAIARDEPRLTAFLPRKFKVAMTACSTDCVVARIHCVAFTPARRGATLGFNVHAGGGLSDYPRLASALDLFVEPDQAPAVVHAALEVYAEHGDYENPSLNRFRALVHQLGPERVAMEIRDRLDFAAPSAGEDLTTWHAEDHIGVHHDAKGTNYVGLCVPLGRLSADELTELARCARVHGDGGVRLTQRQNVILTGVARVDALLAEPLLERLKPEPDPFERGVVACTSAPFCKFAILAMKPYGRRLIDHLRSAVPRGGWDRLEGLRIHMSGCKASCAQVPIAHIGIRATMGKDGEAYYDAFDVALGGDDGAARLARWAMGEVPTDAAFDGITWLLSKVACGELALDKLSEALVPWGGAGTAPYPEEAARTGGQRPEGARIPGSSPVTRAATRAATRSVTRATDGTER
ncbi:MAG: nitrite/sulfite reductase [Acidimicrobiales bacterium]